jgi:metal-dependent amidase/aminoacylase/carboxypeptidase family protein
MTATLAERVSTAYEPMTGSEDFASLPEHVPECFAFVGTGRDSAPLRTPAYEFYDDGLLYGAWFHAAIVRQRLPSVKL